MARLISGGGGGGGGGSGSLQGSGVAGENLLLGHVVAIDPTGAIVRADPTLPGELWRVAGVATAAKSTGDACKYALLGSASVLFAVAPTAFDVGRMVFFGALGTASFTAPAGAAQSRLGVLQAATGNTIAPVLLRIETVALDQ